MIFVFVLECFSVSFQNKPSAAPMHHFMNILEIYNTTGTKLTALQAQYTKNEQKSFNIPLINLAPSALLCDGMFWSHGISFVMVLPICFNNQIPSKISEWT